jgi:hypothetical protein
MSDLLELTLNAHGGLDRWKAVQFIEVAQDVDRLNVVLQPTTTSTSIAAGTLNVLVVGKAMGVRTSLMVTALAAAHTSAALQVGSNAA